MKQRNYITSEKFNEFEVEINKNILGSIIVVIVDRKKYRKTILSFDTCGMITLFPFKKGENKDFGFRLNKKGFIKQQ